MRGDLLGPLEGRIHRVRPADRIMIVGQRAAEVVHDGEEIIETFRDAVGGHTDFVRQSLQRALAARAVVALDINDHRVIEFAGIGDGLNDPPDVVIAIGQTSSIDFHHVGVELLLVGAQGIPSRNFLGSFGEFRAGGNHAERDLARERFFPHLVPTLVELPLELGDPFLRRMMRCVAQTGRVVGEERFFRRERVLLFNPRDGVVGEVCVQVILRVVRRRLDGMGAVEDGRMPLVGVAADEAVEILEAQTGRPEVERPGLAGLPIGHVMVLPEPRRVVAIAPQDFPDGAAALGHQRIVAGITRGHLGDDARAGGVMVASADERRARGRAKRRGMERIVTQTGSRQLVIGRRGNRSAERGRRTPAHIIGHDEQDIWSALGRVNILGKVRRGLRGRAANLPFEELFGARQDVLRPCR